MAETPKPINIGAGMVDQFACQCGWKSEPYFDGAEWALDDFNNHVNEVHMTPTPLLPSSDEVEKLLKLAQAFHAAKPKTILRLCELLRSLQSELASLRAQGDAENTR